MKRAAAAGKPSAVLTLEPHPRSYFRPDEKLFRLTDERQKLRLLASAGLDGAVVLTFNAALAGLPAEQFVSEILVGRLGVSGTHPDVAAAAGMVCDAYSTGDLDTVRFAVGRFIKVIRRLAERTGE